MCNKTTQWKIKGYQNKWLPYPKRNVVLRLPIIRHIRAVLLLIKVEWHYALWASLGRYDVTGFDYWVLRGVWLGEL